MPAKLLQSLLQPRSFSGSWSGRGCGSKRQKKKQMLRKILAVLGWQNLSEVNESSGKERENPETGIGGE